MVEVLLEGLYNAEGEPLHRMGIPSDTKRLTGVVLAQVAAQMRVLIEKEGAREFEDAKRRSNYA